MNRSSEQEALLAEPDAGSDAAALALRADRDGEGWRLTGEKAWISNAPDADVYVVFARTTPDTGARGVSAFLVPAGSAGLEGRPADMVSPHPIGHLTLDGVPVPSQHLLGEVDSGFKVAMATLDLFRPSVGAFAVGMAEAALRIASRHAGERPGFRAPALRLPGRLALPGRCGHRGGLGPASGLRGRRGVRPGGS